MKTSWTAGRRRVVLAGLLLGMVSSSCRTLEDRAGGEPDVTCPTCGTATERIPIVRLTYKRHVCPSCRNVAEYSDRDELLTHTFEGIPPQPLRSVHVCRWCNALVLLCSQCRAR